MRSLRKFSRAAAQVAGPYTRAILAAVCGVSLVRIAASVEAGSAKRRESGERVSDANPPKVRAKRVCRKRERSESADSASETSPPILRAKQVRQQ